MIIRGYCGKCLCPLNIKRFLFHPLGPPSRRCPTRCPASCILETFVLCTQKAPQMDLSALWGKGSHFLLLQAVHLAVEKDGTRYIEADIVILCFSSTGCLSFPHSYISWYKKFPTWVNPCQRNLSIFTSSCCFLGQPTKEYQSSSWLFWMKKSRIGNQGNMSTPAA